MAPTLRAVEALNLVRPLLPAEGEAYFQTISKHRFVTTDRSDQQFFTPKTLIGVLASMVRHRGTIDGDDRDSLAAPGPHCFELPTPSYRYLMAPAQGRLGLLSLEEMQGWIPVTLRETHDPSSRIGFRRGAVRDEQRHLVFTVDAEFQRICNYATVIVAKNWFSEPSTEWSVMDTFLGPPIPPEAQSVTLDSDTAQRHGWADGDTLTVRDLRKILGPGDWRVSARCRNLPGT